MKMAIPTNDGLTLSPDLGQSNGFLILTLELGEITHEEMRWNKLSDIVCASDALLTNIGDCQAIMINDNSTAFNGPASIQKKEIIRTGESIITNAWVHYLENTLRNEANTCCCP
ncbi:MAG: hypothetical protein WCK09_16035 [Bacteroidota bacterium]